MLLKWAALNMPANLENSAVATGLEKSVFIPIPKKGNAKECSNYSTIALISHTSKVMLKILQAKLQQYVNWELPDVQSGFRKGRGTRDQISNICWIIGKAREFQKNTYFCFIDYTKAFDYVDHNKRTGCKLGKEYIKAVYCHPAYLTYAEYISWNARLARLDAWDKLSDLVHWENLGGAGGEGGGWGDRDGEHM